MINESLEGKKTNSIFITITKDMVHEYCQIIQENNPIFHHIDAARKAGYSDLVIPPTYPTLLWQQMNIPWLSDDRSLIQREQTIAFKKPFTINKEYRCYIQLKKIISFHHKQQLKHRLYIWDVDDLTVTSDTTIIL